MLRTTFVLVVLLAVVASAASAGAADVKAIGAKLLDPDVAVAHAASQELRALGAAAAPALPPMILALGRELEPRMQRLHWHPWMKLLPEMQYNVIATLEAIGTDAVAALPALVARFESTGYGRREPILRALLAVGPEQKAALRAIERAMVKGPWRHTKETRALLFDWIEKRSVKGVAMLEGILKGARHDDRVWAIGRLGMLGEPGTQVLARHLGTHGTGLDQHILAALARAGALVDSALPNAVHIFASDALGEDGAALAEGFARDPTTNAPLLASALADVDPSQRPWRILWAAAPDLARMTSARWFASRRPVATDSGFDEADLRRTASRGGGGGGAFEDRLSRRATLLGLRITSAPWSGHRIVTSIQPLFGGPEGSVEGSVHGQRRGTAVELRAPDGYAVGGLYARGGHRVDGLAPVYFRWIDDVLDPEDAFVGPWVGGTGGGGALLLGGSGARVIGVYGRNGADLDAIGLVEVCR